jgi:poly(A) polymerase
VQGDVEVLARCVADKVKGAFFLLDDKRRTCRVVLPVNMQTCRTLDFARLSNDNLEDDLKQRDFTINALAVDINHMDTIIDPLGGQADLSALQLLPCSSASFKTDPVRVFRAVRFQVQDHFQANKQVANDLEKAVMRLPIVSAERKRDEFFRLSENNGFDTALRLMSSWHVFHFYLPSLEKLNNDVSLWEHTLKVITSMELLLNYINDDGDQSIKASLHLLPVFHICNNYKDLIRKQLEGKVHSERNRRSLLLIASLFHEIGKPDCNEFDWDGEMHYYRYEATSSVMMKDIGRELALSNKEINFLQKVIRNHTYLQKNLITNRTLIRECIFDFSQRVGEFGVECCLLALACEISKIISKTDQPDDLLEEINTFLDAWFFHKNEWITPERLLSGDEIIKLLHERSGPRVGFYLKALIKAQAIGQVKSRREAQEFITDLDRQNRQNSPGVR